MSTASLPLARSDGGLRAVKGVRVGRRDPVQPAMVAQGHRRAEAERLHERPADVVCRVRGDSSLRRTSRTRSPPRSHGPGPRARPPGRRLGAAGSGLRLPCSGSGPDYLDGYARTRHRGRRSAALAQHFARRHRALRERTLGDLHRLDESRPRTSSSTVWNSARPACATRRMSS